MNENNDEPDLFPDLPRVKKKKVSHREKLTADLNKTRMTYGVTTPQIAERIRVPSRTVEKWVLASSLPPEWACEMVLERLRRFWVLT